jgi:uncharacterized membrane protein
MHDLIEDAAPGMFGGTYGTVTWLNNRGQVTGTMNLAGDRSWRSFLWDRGVVRDLGTLGGVMTTSSWMNDTGSIVGKSDVTEVCQACTTGNGLQLHHPFLWKNGHMKDLGLLPGDNVGTAYSVNRSDQIVGRSLVCTLVEPNDSCSGAGYHAFLWEQGSLADLQTLVLPGAGMTVDDAIDINDRGEIAGSGLLPNGDRHALLLVPVDQDSKDAHSVNTDAGQIPDGRMAATTARRFGSHGTSRPGLLRARE